MRLFWCEKTRAQRVAWMMEELGQPYERVRIDIRDEASKNDDDFRAASPMGKVPALEDGPVKLWDSGAICLYLADKYPGAGLTVPVNDPQRGAFLQWIMFTNAVIEPAMGEKFAGSDPDRLRHGWGSFEQMIDVLGRGLAKGPWLLGNRFTAADVLVGSSVHFLDVFGILGDSGSLKSYAERCHARPAFQRAQSFEAST